MRRVEQQQGRAGSPGPPACPARFRGHRASGQGPGCARRWRMASATRTASIGRIAERRLEQVRIARMGLQRRGHVRRQAGGQGQGPRHAQLLRQVGPAAGLLGHLGGVLQRAEHLVLQRPARLDDRFAGLGIHRLRSGAAVPEHIVGPDIAVSKFDGAVRVARPAASCRRSCARGRYTPALSMCATPGEAEGVVVPCPGCRRRPDGGPGADRPRPAPAGGRCRRPRCCRSTAARPRTGSCPARAWVR